MLDQVMNFDFDHTQKGFEKILAKRARYVRQYLDAKDKIGALTCWLRSPFYIVAWNIMWTFVGKITGKEDKDMCDHIDYLCDYGLSGDDANYELEIDGPVGIIAPRCSYKHLYKFADLIYTHRAKFAWFIIQYRKILVSQDDWNREKAEKKRQACQHAKKLPISKDNLSF